MKTTVIICEYNPLTYGHIRHLRLAREETGADSVICVMSGSFTQRGEPAILDRYARAELAARLGADAVVELPLIYAASPAENFAYGAMKTVSALPDARCVSFGSECGDLRLLEKTADFTSNEPAEFKTLLAERLADGDSYPKAYSQALAKYAETRPDCAEISDILNHPNNLLGVCYMKAAKKLGLSVDFHTVKRESDVAEGDSIGSYPSAQAVRAAIRTERFDEVKKLVHPYCFEWLKDIRTDGSIFNDLCLFKMKSINGFDLAGYYDVDAESGMHNRLKLAASAASSFEEFIERARTKKYTLARLRRVCIYALFDITKKMYEEACARPPHVSVLALRRERVDILSALKNSCPNVLARYSDIDKVDKSLRFLIKLDFSAHGVLNMINRTQRYTKSLVMV